MIDSGVDNYDETRNSLLLTTNNTCIMNGEDESEITVRDLRQEINKVAEQNQLQAATEETNWDNLIPQPPDGGWGWVVMVASFFNNFILDGIAYCFGVFLQEYAREFNASVSDVSLANSLLCGVYLLVGPIVGALVNKYGCRAIGMVGSLVGAVAFIISAFSTNIYMFQITYGLLGGFGFGMMYLPAVVSVGHYFERRRAIATGIAVCGTGIGTFCLAPVGKLLIEHFNWKGSQYILAGIILQGCISSALMRPLDVKRIKKPAESKIKEPLVEDPSKSKRSLLTASQQFRLTTSDNPGDRLHASAFLHKRTTSDSGKPSHLSAAELRRPLYRKDIFYSGSIYNISHVKSQISVQDYITSVYDVHKQQEATRFSCFDKLPKPMADILAEMLDITVLRNKSMLLFCAANIVGMLGFYVPIIFTASRAIKLGVPVTQAALLLSIMGACNTIGRILSGFLSFAPNVSPLLVNNICVTISGVAVLLTPLCNTYPLMIAAIAAYGLFCSTFVSLAPIIICDIVGLDKLTNGFGLLGLVRGITAIAGPPLEGWLYDITGNYDATFYAGGTCILLCGLLHCLLMHPFFKKSCAVYINSKQ